MLTRLGGKCPLIVTDAFLMSRGLPQKLQALIQETGIECGIFSETVPDPTTEAVAIGVRLCRRQARQSSEPRWREPD